MKVNRSICAAVIVLVALTLFAGWTVATNIAEQQEKFDYIELQLDYIELQIKHLKLEAEDQTEHLKLLRDHLSLQDQYIELLKQYLALLDALTQETEGGEPPR